jgi:hypothetical protein
LNPGAIRWNLALTLPSPSQDTTQSWRLTLNLYNAVQTEVTGLNLLRNYEQDHPLDKQPKLAEVIEKGL